MNRILSTTGLLLAGIFLLSACATSQNTSTDSTEKTSKQVTRPKDVAPGTADIRAQILSVDRSDDEVWKVKARVQRVLAYGQGAPILTPSQEIEIRVNIADKDETDRPDLKKGDRIEWNIKFSGEQMMGATGAGYWHLRTILE
jgi:hypothetical protein